MKKGYLFLESGGAAMLRWSDHEPSFWTRDVDSTNIMKDSLVWRNKKNWLRQAYRCEKCGLFVFEEKYTPPSEEEKKQSIS